LGREKRKNTEGGGCNYKAKGQIEGKLVRKNILGGLPIIAMSRRESIPCQEYAPEGDWFGYKKNHLLPREEKGDVQESPKLSLSNKGGGRGKLFEKKALSIKRA